MSNTSAHQNAASGGWSRANRCGVPVFALDRWASLDRFLVLGSEGGTYYATEQELGLEHLENVQSLLDVDGPRVVSRIVAISISGRAPRNSQAVGALALAASIGLLERKGQIPVSADHMTGDTPARAETRRLALAALSKVCRIPTDLFAFVSLVRRLRGWGPSLSKAVANWYRQAPLDRLTLHAIKYEERKGLSHADLLRLSHPRIEAQDDERHALVRWMLNGGISAGLDARLEAEAAGIMENNTPSAALRQLAGAEDLLRINRLGAARQDEVKAEKRAIVAAERKVIKDAWKVFKADVKAWEAENQAHLEAIRHNKKVRQQAREEHRTTRGLFGVSYSLLEAAYGLTDVALDYISETANDDWNEDYQDGLMDDERLTYVHVPPATRARPEAPERQARVWRSSSNPAEEPKVRFFMPEEVAQAVDLIERYSLPHEVVPSHLKKERAVWDALLVDMPLQAMLRNLVNMAKVGLLPPGSDAAAFVASRLNDMTVVRQSRIHPYLVLQALERYRQGDCDPNTMDDASYYSYIHLVRHRREQAWSVAPEVVAALNSCYLLAFHNVTPCQARLMLGVDISGSMGSAFIGDGAISARVGAAAMCMVTARTESYWQAFGYTSGRRMYGDVGNDNQVDQVFPGLTRLKLDARSSLDEITARMRRLPMGSTDCALLIRYAEMNEIEVDAFVSYTDNEHNSGPMTPDEAMASYRAASGINAKMVCVGMTATDYTIANPNDPLCLNVVGFDAAAPRIISDFIAGRI